MERVLQCGRLATLLLAVALSLIVPAAPRAEPEPQTGLLWNRTGLPAVFPLQVRTAADLDYLVTLSEIGDERTVLAAFVRGGANFRVLVPPGVFDVSVAAGRRWQDAEQLFGPQTQFFNLPEPLPFRIKGLSVRQGHMIDLRQAFGGRASFETAPRRLCQTLRLAPESRWDVWPGPDPDEPGVRVPRFEVRPRLC